MTTFKVKDHMREYNSWLGARHRCESDKHPHWEDYGGRGIAMCERWSESFERFYDDMGPRPEGLELDRIDNDGDYEPGNCRWTTRSENSLNKFRRTPKPKREVPYIVSQADLARLARIDRVHERYQADIDVLLTEVQRLRDERDALIGTIKDKIRPEHWTPTVRETTDYPDKHTPKPERLRISGSKRESRAERLARLAEIRAGL
jgi:hypothetical protein